MIPNKKIPATLCCILALAMSSIGNAQENYPSATIKLIMGFPPGGSTDVLARVMAQNPKVFISSPPLAQALAAGEIGAALLNNPSSLKSLMNSGAPINYNVPNPAYGFQVFVTALGWSKRPNAGLVLADWLMSRDGQTVWSGTGESASPLKGIPGAAEVPGTVKFYNVAEWTSEAVKRYTDRWNQQYKK